MGAPSLTRRGAAYRYGIKRRTPRRSEGSRSLWFRTDQFADVQFELVLKIHGLQAAFLVVLSPGLRARGLVTPTEEVEEVTSS